ncbi:MAG: hypothetical protein V3W52_06310 [Syntrophobacteria bacterium]
MNCCRETTKMGVPPGNRPAVPRDWFRGVPERYVAGADTRGRQEGRPYPWSQQVIHVISGLDIQSVLWTNLTICNELDVIPQHIPCVFTAVYNF